MKYVDVKGAKLIFIGKGDRTEYFKRLCKKYKIKHEFKGELQGKKLIREYDNSDVLILPLCFLSY